MSFYQRGSSSSGGGGGGGGLDRALGPGVHGPTPVEESAVTLTGRAKPRCDQT